MESGCTIGSWNCSWRQGTHRRYHHRGVQSIHGSNLGDDLGGAGGDITAVYCVGIEVNIQDHFISPYYKAGLACTVSLNIEQPHHGYLVLASVFDHMHTDFELGEFCFNGLEPNWILTCLLEVPGAEMVVHFENIQCEVAWELVHLVFASEVVPVHIIDS